MKRLVFTLAWLTVGGMWMGQVPAEKVPTPTETAALMKLDTDDDGSISKAEAEGNPEVLKNWKRMDANQNGYLDPAEIAMMVEVGGGD